MRFCEALDFDKIAFSCRGASCEEVIDELIGLFKRDRRVVDLGRLREAILARESLGTTAVGRGFAIPHARTEAVRSIIAAFGRLEIPIDFRAPDGKPVEWVFLIASNEADLGSYLKLLRKIAVMLRGPGLHRRLEEAGSARAIQEVLTREEEWSALFA